MFPGRATPNRPQWQFNTRPESSFQASLNEISFFRDTTRFAHSISIIDFDMLPSNWKFFPPIGSIRREIANNFQLRWWGPIQAWPAAQTRRTKTRVCQIALPTSTSSVQPGVKNEKAIALIPFGMAFTLASQASRNASQINSSAT